MRRTVAIIVLVVLAIASWVGYRTLSARNHLDAAKNHLAAARSALLDRDLGRARSQINAAGKDTAAARSATDDPVVAAVSHLPLLGRSLRVVRGVTTAADDISRQVLPGGLKLSESLDPKKLRRSNGTFDVQALADAQAPARDLATRMGEIRKDVRALPHNLVLGPVAGARTSFSKEVDQLDSALRGASDAVAVAPALLGQDRPRRWFVLIQQYGESRGTGGLPGGFAVLRADHGRLTVEAQGSKSELNGPAVPGTSVPAEFRNRYLYDGSLDTWANINLSPDLPVVADLIGERWYAQAHQRIDGVFALDARSMSLILKGGPPIALGGGKTLPADQIEDYLNIGQYVGASTDPTKVGTRRDQLVDVAKQVLERLTSGGGNSTALLKGMVDAVRSGHLRVATRVNPIAAVMARDELDGALPGGAAPLAYPVINNASGSKLDVFLDRSLSYSGGECKGNRRKTRIEVDLTNRAPALASLPPYVTINGSGLTARRSTTNEALLEVYGTRGAALLRATLDGQAVSTTPGRTKTQLFPFSTFGIPSWQVYVNLPPGRTQRLVLDLSEPVARGRPRVARQPLARDLDARIALPTC